MNLLPNQKIYTILIALLKYCFLIINFTLIYVRKNHFSLILCKFLTIKKLGVKIQKAQEQI